MVKNELEDRGVVMVMYNYVYKGDSTLNRRPVRSLSGSVFHIRVFSASA